MTTATRLSALAGLMLLASTSLRAETVVDEEFKPGLWLSSGMFSYHSDRDANYRERNWGVGLEYELNRDWALLGGTYLNSVNERSYYLGATWQPWTIGPMRAGVLLGGVTNYPEINGGKPFFGAMPWLSWKGERFGVNFTGYPPLGNDITGMVAVQFMLRLN